MSNVVSLDDYRPPNDDESVVFVPHFDNVLKKMRVGGVTPNAVEKLLAVHDMSAQAYVQHIFKRFNSGDWGDICEEDSESNKLSLTNGGMVMGVYPLHPSEPEERKVWMVMDHGHETATLLMPEDY